MFTAELPYTIDDKTFKGYVAYDDSYTDQRPAMMIFHAFEGCNDLMKQHARDAAQKGYVGFAVDMYGDGVVAHTLEDCMAHMNECAQDRQVLRQRALAAFNMVKTIEVTNADKVAAVGFCFGGKCALDLARTGENLKAAVCMHGGLDAPEGMDKVSIPASILVINGYIDPQLPKDGLIAFADEMAEVGADWQMHYLGNAKHAFTDPDAASIGGPEMGRVYDKLATERSWAMTYNLFDEKFA